MKRCFLLGSVLALVALVASVDVAQAQRRGGRGGEGGGYYSGRGWDGGGYYGDGYRGGRGWGGYGYSPYYSGYYSGYSPNNRGWAWSTPSNSWDWGTSMSNDAYGYSDNTSSSGYGDYGYSDCGSYGYMGPSGGYYGDYSSGRTNGQDGTYGAFDNQPMNTRNTAAVRVILPNPRAGVWFEGQPTRQMGFDRLYISPELQPGNYVYTVKASWMQNGQEVTREKKVKVRPGQGAMVDFRQEGSMGSEYLPRPGMRSEFEYGREPGARYGEFEGAENQFVIVSTGPDQIVVTDLNGQNQRTLRLGANADVLISGRKTQITDLKPGMHVILTPDHTNAQQVQKIEVAPEGAGMNQQFDRNKQPGTFDQTPRQDQNLPRRTDQNFPRGATERNLSPSGMDRNLPPQRTNRNNENLPKPQDRNAPPPSNPR
jgi:uncharacterized protein (TIGR03000 family)